MKDDASDAYNAGGSKRMVKAAARAPVRRWWKQKVEMRSDLVKACLRRVHAGHGYAKLSCSLASAAKRIALDAVAELSSFARESSGANRAT